MNNNKQRLANRFLYKLALGVYGNGFAKRHLTIDRSGLQDTKPPYIVLSTHASNADVFGTAVALTPQVLNFVASIDQLVGFHFIKERLGLIPKRQFTVDLSLVRLIKSVTDKGRGVAIFPEGKLSVDGRNSVLAVNLGKLAKVLRLPIVTAHFDGSYLYKPRWAINARPSVKAKATIETTVTQWEADNLSAEALSAKLIQRLTYDDNLYQLQEHIEIKENNRAEGLHTILYKCPVCQAEFCNDTKDDKLYCSMCGAIHELQPDGRLRSITGDNTMYSSVPEWTDFERLSVRKEIMDGSYLMEYDCVVTSIPTDKHYVELGSGRLVSDIDGIYLSIAGEVIHFPPKAFYTIPFNTKYVFLSTESNTYKVDLGAYNGETAKLNFAVEQLYKSFQ